MTITSDHIPDCNYPLRVDPALEIDSSRDFASDLGFRNYVGPGHHEPNSGSFGSWVDRRRSCHSCWQELDIDHNHFDIHSDSEAEAEEARHVLVVRTEDQATLRTGCHC